MKYFFAFALLITLVTSCKKDDDDHETFVGTITIDTPVANDTVHGGNSFFVTGTITGNMEMHGYHIVVYNETDQSVVYENQYHIHGESYVVNEAVTHTLVAGTPLRLYIEAAGDHDGQTVTKERLFYYAP